MRITYKINQLDIKLNPVESMRYLSRPKLGWLAVIRKSLGMSRAQLAAQLRITRNSIQKIEQSEAANTISLNTLQKAANGLGCDVYYVLLPKDKSFLDFVTKQAKRIARKVVLNSAKHMALEDQAALDKIEEQVELLADELLHSKLKELWKYEV